MSTPPIDSPAGQLRIALRGHGDETERLMALANVRRRLVEEEEQIAFSMRLHGAPWEDIAQAFGITRQAAHKRFAGAAILDRLRSIDVKTGKTFDEPVGPFYDSDAWEQLTIDG